MKRSFTLIELVVVILIMGIIVFLLMPDLSARYHEVKFENFSCRLLQFLKSVQDSSLKENSLLEVKFETGVFRVNRAEQKAESIAVPEEYRVDTDIDRVVFHPSGLLRVYSRERILNSAQIVLHFRGSIKKILFYSEAGNVFIQE